MHAFFSSLKEFLVKQLCAMHPALGRRALEDFFLNVDYRSSAWPDINEYTDYSVFDGLNDQEQEKFKRNFLFLKTQASYCFSYDDGYPRNYFLPVRHFEEHINQLRKGYSTRYLSMWCEGLCLSYIKAFLMFGDRGISQFACHLMLLSQPVSGACFYGVPMQLNEAINRGKESYKNFTRSEARHDAESSGAFMEAFRQYDNYSFDILELSAFIDQVLFCHKGAVVDRPNIGKEQPRTKFPQLSDWYTECFNTMASWGVKEKGRLSFKVEPLEVACASFEDVLNMLDMLINEHGAFVIYTGIVGTMDKGDGKKRFNHLVALIVDERHITLFDSGSPYYFVRVLKKDRAALVDHIIWSCSCSEPEDNRIFKVYVDGSIDEPIGNYTDNM